MRVNASEKIGSVRIGNVSAENRTIGRRTEGRVFTGPGRDVVLAIGAHAGTDSLHVLDSIVRRLLVNKGADWTNAILSEYLGLFDDSAGIFSLVWDDPTGQVVSHGAIFHSAAYPWAGLLAHVRTADRFQGLGLGTLVTEQVTAAAFDQGVQLVALATDDKVHRMEEGERAAYSMYSRIGYARLAEKRLADTVDWMMVIDEPILRQSQTAKQQNNGRFPPKLADMLACLQDRLVSETRARFGVSSATTTIESVSAGDLANLFVLVNLCPADDFRLKLSSWYIHHGPEVERTFIATLRQAIVDKDRLNDASLVLRDTDGAINAVCAAQQLPPFTRQAYAIDFYCLPRLLKAAGGRVSQLVQQTVERIDASPDRPHPCRLSFVGIDAEKIGLFESLGFSKTSDTTQFFGLDDQVALEALELSKTLA